jgi:hypothetical protein
LRIKDPEMALHFYNHGKFFAPVQINIGYVFIVCGIFFSFYKLSALLFVIPGTFMAFTSTGAVLDTVNKTVKSYTRHFGLITTGKWISINGFNRFVIQRATRKYTSYSRGSVSFDMNISDIKLLLASPKGSKKLLIARFKSFEEAQKAKEELGILLFGADQNELPEK